MIEPFLYLISGEPEAPAYAEKAPVDFKDAAAGLWLIPMTSRILSGDRPLYSAEEIEKDPGIMRAASANTVKNQIRKNTDNDFVSIRSNRTEMPCAALFVSKGRDKAFKAAGIDPSAYYAIFITADEIMFADKSKYKPAQIRKVIASIRNKMASLFPNASPVLSAAIFEYDGGSGRYVEL